MGTYWLYYVGVIALSQALDQPAIMLAILPFIVARRWLPDPWVLLRTFGRTRALRAQIEANPANVTARRDLARVYLDRLRPGAALALIDEARERDQDSAELLYLRGVALHRTGRHEEALAPLVEAVDRDPRVSFGEPYLIAGDALSELGRHAEAVDAYERYVDKNSSSIQGWTKLGLAHRNADEKEAEARALREATRTWGQIPWYLRRQQVGWFVRAQLHRLGL
ncbi:MAG: tetratricopeptide repeat protein [Sandaracinaceae bacterium]